MMNSMGGDMQDLVDRLQKSKEAIQNLLVHL